jgi:hypothetical protein
MIKDEAGNRRFYGVYRGVVTDTLDPLGKSRVRLKVPQVLLEEETGWAWGINQPGVSRQLPVVNEGVFVMFEGGDPSFPIWLGAFEGTANPYVDLNYGGWYDLLTQSVTTTSVGQPVLIRHIDVERGFSVVSNSRITAARTGVYNLAFSFQLHYEGGGGSGNTVEIWLTKNGEAIADSNTRINVTSSNPYVVAAWNFFKQMDAGDYIEVYWATNNNKIKIAYNTETMDGPAIPSAIITVNQIG